MNEGLGQALGKRKGHLINTEFFSCFCLFETISGAYLDTGFIFNPSVFELCTTRLRPM